MDPDKDSDRRGDDGRLRFLQACSHSAQRNLALCPALLSHDEFLGVFSFHRASYCVQARYIAQHMSRSDVRLRVCHTRVSCHN